MKFEDAIEKATRGKNGSSAKVGLGYYPFTDECPHDGKKCSGNRCPLFEPKEKKCAEFEIRRAIHHVFRVVDTYFLTICGDPCCWLSVHNYHDYHDMNKGEAALRFGVDIHGCSRLASELALKDSGLVKYFELPPDDTHIKYFPYEYASVAKIEDFLKIVRKYQKKFVVCLKRRSTCVECGKIDDEPSYYDTKSGPKPVCYSCKEKLIHGHINKMFGG